MCIIYSGNFSCNGGVPLSKDESIKKIINQFKKHGGEVVSVTQESGKTHKDTPLITLEVKTNGMKSLKFLDKIKKDPRINIREAHPKSQTMTPHEQGQQYIIDKIKTDLAKIEKESKGMDLVFDLLELLKSLEVVPENEIK